TRRLSVYFAKPSWGGAGPSSANFAPMAGDPIERFLASPSLSDGTRRAYRSDLEEFTSWLRRTGRTLDGMDSAALSAYAAELGASRPGRTPRRLAPATIARKLAAVRALLRFALGPDRVPEGSFAPRRSRRLPEAPRADELDRTLSSFEAE